MASIISAGTSSGTALNFTGDTSGNLAFQTGAGANTMTVPNTTGTLALTNQVIGISQTTQNVTSSRVLGTTYTNSTGKPIVVYCCMSNTVGNALVISSIDGVGIYGASVAAAGANYYGITLVVPNGATYTNNMNGAPVLQLWIETR
jgi:hypothetical protein